MLKLACKTVVAVATIKFLYETGKTIYENKEAFRQAFKK